MKKLSLLFAICIISIASSAQTMSHILKGQINDAHGNPIVSAKIFNQSDTLEVTYSDKLGMFILESKTAVKQLTVQRKGMKDLHVEPSATFVSLVMAYNTPRTKHDRTVIPPPVEAEEDLLDIVEIQAEESVMYEVQPMKAARLNMATSGAALGKWSLPVQEPRNTESYSDIAENDFHNALSEPLSTFSIDVDRASYSNVRRFINNGQLPPTNAVRVEEMINYFNYNYEAPKGNDPVKIFTEVCQSPWNEEFQLVQIGVKARELDVDNLPPSNIVFLIDVSGSMSQQNKLPLLKSSMKMLVQKMRKEDKVAIVVYAGAAGLVLESTSGAEKQAIYNAIDNLNAGGSTAGGAGIKLAYKVALENLVEKGNNRIVLATDGDFNVGASSDDDMEKLIMSKRNQGVFLTVLGFGMGNYKDSKMEVLADKGNGNYAYIDNITEAKKTLVNEFGGTMFTIAKDVKIQVEFNPANVAEYRLIGYENRILNKEDFNNDKKDAGEMGVGHVVTAIYEVVPVGASSNRVDPLKYQKVDVLEKKAILTDEMLTVKLRYKEPDGDKSKLISTVVKLNSQSLSKASENLRWSASVAGFGMLLRQSDHIGSATYASVIQSAESAVGKDKEGYRRECLQLMKSAELLKKSNTASR